jgi:hypothetical protein
MAAMSRDVAAMLDVDPFISAISPFPLRNFAFRDFAISSRRLRRTFAFAS